MERARAWLARTPGRDAVERRQAYRLQAFLLIVATAFALGALGNAITGLLQRGGTRLHVQIAVTPFEGGRCA